MVPFWFKPKAREGNALAFHFPIFWSSNLRVGATMEATGVVVEASAVDVEVEIINSSEVEAVDVQTALDSTR